ncbi:uncharacterized protein L201_003622 [Kwoniella dendrophila CBS 6074]|uniref:Uncharacterized protein n=1 Tax=Kwoniella dendrophila CBS 6074 TaxID=1295534 RepID=A0AAX4JTQ1_9TREE
MLRLNGSNQSLNEDQDQVNEMEPLLTQFWNQSISWTEKQGSWVQLNFTGTDIWVYGITGPYQGQIEFILDDQNLGLCSQNNEETDYHHQIYDIHDMEDNPHILRSVNVDRRMSFDYAIVQSQNSSHRQYQQESFYESSRQLNQLPSTSQEEISISSSSAIRELAAQATSSIFASSGITSMLSERPTISSSAGPAHLVSSQATSISSPTDFGIQAAQA